MRRVVAAVAALGLAAGPARADGGPPQTLGIAFKHGDPHALYVMTNYGLIVSHDDGCTFYWICETNIGYGNTYIPKIAVTDDGAILATTFGGLRASRDGGCTFETPAGPTADIAVEGLALGPNGDVWVGAAESGKTNDVFMSRDGARTFASQGLPSDVIMWRSIKVAPSDPARVYVSGTEYPKTAHLRRTEGTGWFVSPLTGIALGPSGLLAVAAVDPTDPGTVYVIAEGAVPGGDVLYRSADGGATFTQVLIVTSPIGGFTARIGDVVARGAEVYVTTRLKDDEKGTLKGGLVYVSSSRGAAFEALADAPELMCLATAPDDALVGCGANWQPDYKAVARFDGAEWTKVWRWVELAGPLACAPGTGGHDVCENYWGFIDLTLMTSGPACGPLASDAGVGIPKPPDDSGCCESSTSRPTGIVWAFVLGWWLRRRKR